jgi:hypothetical protein
MDGPSNKFDLQASSNEIWSPTVKVSGDLESCRYANGNVRSQQQRPQLKRLAYFYLLDSRNAGLKHSHATRRFACDLLATGPNTEPV